MKKASFVLSFIMMIVVFSSSCSGHNGIMIKHLSDERNYETYTVTYEKILFNKSEGYATLTVSGFNKEQLSGFLGFHYTEGDSTEVSINLCILDANYLILKENGFFETVKEKECIQIQSSNWIYMDGNFFYLAGLTCNNVEYLNFEVGLQNIRDYMRSNVSLL